MSPEQWRNSRGLSQSAMARVLGVSGKNPARTWQRWESGERQPPLKVIRKVETLTDGKVTMLSWIELRSEESERAA